ncbi:MAG: hypothetical protein ACKKL4_00930 [Patescibacteria group bacterium]
MSITHNSKESLELSLTPAFFAAGCCATLPIMVVFGLSLAEESLIWYQWYFRIGGVFILLGSLIWYFYKSGIKSYVDFQNNKMMILLISLHTILYCGLLYLFFIKIITPMLWYYLVGEIHNCCNI